MDARWRSFPATVRGPGTGSLFIVGGGDMSHQLVSTFLSLAGGTTRCRLVIFPTGLDDEMLAQPRLPQLISRPWVDAGLPAASITILHTRDRQIADSEDFNAPLREATAVWYDGGRQWRFVDAYRGTRAEQEVRKVLSRGGVVGGSSAGATVLGEFLARGDTQSNQLLIGDHTEGFALLQGVAIDQHLLKRNRQFDLLKVLAVHPHLLGLGIDEGTALLVTEERADVIGRSYVAVYNSTEWLATVDAAGSEEQGHDPFFLLGDGQALDLVTRLPVGGESAGQIEDELMRAILSDRQLVVALRQRGAQQLLVHLQMDPRGAINTYKESAGAMAFIHTLYAAIERLRTDGQASATL